MQTPAIITLLAGSRYLRCGLRLGAALAIAAVIFATPPARAERIVPLALPDLAIPGFHFPESEATITRWLTGSEIRSGTADELSAADRIRLHGWGLWTALTAESMQMYEGQRLRVFETWLTPDDLTDNASVRTVAALAEMPRRRATLGDVGEMAMLAPGGRRGRAALAPTRPAVAPPDASPASDPTPEVDRVIGFVKFDPTAAEHTIQQDLLHTATLDALLFGGAQQIAPFPTTSVVVKPVFQIIKTQDLIEGRYYPLKAWSGPPATPQAFPPAQWREGVWIDITGGGGGHGAVDSTFASDGSSRTPETTYPLSSLIHYQLSAVDAAALNANKPGSEANPGDYAILVAMHVAGREIARWTWQTFWWTQNPDNPPAPSSPAIAGRRPDQLRGAARNYAMAQTYTMLNPDPPHVGGENGGAAVYAYNPWIEARFAPADLPDSLPGLDPDGQPAGNNYGTQTNCMSCHAQATYNPNHRITAPRFAGARYVDMADPQYAGTLQVDFLWSIARHSK